MLECSMSRFAFIALMMAAPVTLGQAFPNKPFRVITSAAGGGADIIACVIAQGMTTMGQPTHVENRGGNAIIQVEALLKSPPDGYTVLISGNTMWLFPFMDEKVTFDPMRDFTPVTITSSSPLVLAVSPSLPVSSVKDLIAMAKAKPGTLNYASGVTGSATHLTAELFKSMAGADLTRVPYNGAGPAAIALIAGQVQVMFNVVTSVMPYVKSGKMKALAVSSTAPTPLAPDVPPMTDSGLPGYEALVFHAVFAPANTPRTAINRLNEGIVRVYARPITPLAYNR